MTKRRRIKKFKKRIDKHYKEVLSYDLEFRSLYVAIHGPIFLSNTWDGKWSIIRFRENMQKIMQRAMDLKAFL
jgi:hypothetical protein